ncbi:MAG: hypothetical protein JWN93_3636 [Hyphomicrobiales bacterium]|nr:hypothetical protein [Hyphomicrobiales bacterium]
MTGGPEFRVGPLLEDHDRAAFRCGDEALDRYLQTQAAQDMRRKANAVFVMVRPSAPGAVVGFYTLCATALEPGAVPEAARKRLPRYPLVSATLLGRLAISRDDQGRGLGSALLGHALRSALQNAGLVGSSMVVTDAASAGAQRFYEAHGFIALPLSMRLILPMATIAALPLAP